MKDETESHAYTHPVSAYTFLNRLFDLATEGDPRASLVTLGSLCFETVAGGWDRPVYL